MSEEDRPLTIDVIEPGTPEHEAICKAAILITETMQVNNIKGLDAFSGICIFLAQMFHDNELDVDRMLKGLSNTIRGHVKLLKDIK